MKHRDTIMTFRALAAVLFLGLTGLAHAQQRFLVEGPVYRRGLRYEQ